MAVIEQPLDTTEMSVRSLDDRLAEIVGLLNVCTAELVDLIAQALRTGAWEGFGIRSPAHWVTWKCGVSPARARRLVTLAQALADLPETARRFAAGQLTEDQVAVVARHTDADHDTHVAELAPSLTVPQLNRVLPSVPRRERRADDDDDRSAAPAQKGDASGVDADGRAAGPRREVTLGHDHRGGFWCSIHLPADEGALLERGLIEARQAEYRSRQPEGEATVDADGVSWADALVRLVETGLCGLDTTASAGRPPGERTQVIVHLDADHDAPPRLHLGPVLPQAIADHMSCDATVRYQLARSGMPIARGRRRRTVSYGLRVVIEDRDQGCRVPGCGHRRWLHIHHIVHWRHGGATDPANLVALCPAHHRMVHLGRLRVSGDPGRGDSLRWCDEQGRALVPFRPRPPDRPPARAARAYGLPPADWRHPAGEPLDSRWIAWT